MDAFMEELRRFDTHGTLCTTPLLLNLMLSEYLRHEAIDSAIQFDGAAARQYCTQTFAMTSHC